MLTAADITISLQYRYTPHTTLRSTVQHQITTVAVTPTASRYERASYCTTTVERLLLYHFVPMERTIVSIIACHSSSAKIWVPIPHRQSSFINHQPSSIIILHQSYFPENRTAGCTIEHQRRVLDCRCVPRGVTVLAVVRLPQTVVTPRLQRQHQPSVFLSLWSPFPS
jgi:hypothetical protein